MPSPILPDGRMVPLPIPDKKSPIRYADIEINGENIAPLVSRLTRGRIKPHYRAHLDPDLSQRSYPRLVGWKPLFGQTGAAQGHLRRNGIQVGDIFLFFGLFRQTTYASGSYDWQRNSLSIHVLWGWLQVGQVIPLPLGTETLPGWAAYHPHCHRGPERNNAIYVSAPHMTLSAAHPEGSCGAGLFPYFSVTHQLTAPSARNPSLWELPGWLYPREGRSPLTYHGDLRRWKETNARCELRTAGRGQEFILDTDDYPEALGWLASLLTF